MDYNDVLELFEKTFDKKLNGVVCDLDKCYTVSDSDTYSFYVLDKHSKTFEELDFIQMGSFNHSLTEEQLDRKGITVVNGRLT